MVKHQFKKEYLLLVKITSLNYCSTGDDCRLQGTNTPRHDGIICCQLRR